MRVRQHSEADHVAFRADVEAMMALVESHGLTVEWIRGKSRWLVNHWGLRTTLILVTQTPGTDEDGNFIDTTFHSGGREFGTPVEVGRDTLRLMGVDDGDLFEVSPEHPDVIKEQMKSANRLIAEWKAPKTRKRPHRYNMGKPRLYAGTPEFEARWAIPRLNRGQQP